MATIFYLPSTGDAPITNVTPQSGWTKSSIIRLPTYTTKQSTSLSLRTVAWPDTASGDWIWWQFVSPPVDGIYTLTGTFSIAIGKCAETSASGNANISCAVTVVSNDGNTSRGQPLNVSRGSTEFPTIGSGPLSRTRNGTALTLTNISTVAGDRIIIEIGVGGTSPAVQNIQMQIGDNNASDYNYTAGDATDKNDTFQLSTTLGFSAETLAGQPTAKRLGGIPFVGTQRRVW